MKPARAILDVLFPKVRAEMLRLLFSSPQKQRYVRELMSMSDLALSTVQDELRKLHAVGLVSSWSKYRRRFYRANREHPLFPHLLRLVQLSERLPRTDHATLHRPVCRRKRKKRSSSHATLPPNRPINWNLFSHRNKP